MTQGGHPTPGTNYTVRAGDNLWVIAVQAYGSGTEWPKIYDANKQVIGNNPNLIRPGQVLHIPPTAPIPVPVSTPLRNDEDIQGDILAAFNKDYRTYLFLRLPDQARGRAWLGALIPYIAKNKDVAAFNTLFSLGHSGSGKDPEDLKATWVNVSLTYEGLKLLLKADPAAALDAQQFDAFVGGALGSVDVNGDTGQSDPKNWVVGGSNQTIHALLNIQSDDPDDLAEKVQELQTLANQHGVTTVFRQDGATLPDNLRGHEHFGFKDGISQPGIANFDAPDPHAPGFVQGHPGTEILKAGEFILGQDVEPDFGQTKFAPDPSLSWMVNGSFQVFRRLSQDVAGFHTQLSDSVKALPQDDPLRESLGAKLVGRWQSGTPTTLSPDKDNNLTDDAIINNFDYSNDPDGAGCPRFAHIRKVYPRDHDFASNRAKRILRRGVPFGLPFDPAKGNGYDANAERGLVFVAYMSDIHNKFEFLNAAWVNNPGFPTQNAGPDPIIGDCPRPAPSTVRPGFSQDFHLFVHATGALYAFVPSISALKGIASGAH